MTKEQELTLDEKIQRLNELVAWFESDEFSLDEATEKYRSANELLKQINQDVAKLEQEFVVVGESVD